ncbi:Source PGD [Phytophthora oleae]|uniref:Source PGD n=1 Tax=Phytophthora oleae TaxID=2107226 RepID=A0ABD3F892_9STRA
MQALRVDTVFNADQTAVFFEYVPKTTIFKKGAKPVWVRCGGKEKDRVSVMLLGNSQKVSPSKVTETDDENIRLRQGFGIHVWKEIKELQKEGRVVIYGNPKGWWNEKLSILFLERPFGSMRPRLKRFS